MHNQATDRKEVPTHAQKLGLFAMAAAQGVLLVATDDVGFGVVLVDVQVVDRPEVDSLALEFLCRQFVSILITLGQFHFDKGVDAKATH